MTKDRWIQSAFTNDELVAELLLRIKHSSDSVSLRSRPAPATATVTPITSILPARWGNRKIRSKSNAPTAAVVNGFGKEHRGSPTTHLSWRGGAGSSSEESSRPSDLSSGCRSVKNLQANEAASISSNHKSEKRKELGSMRVNLNKEMELCSVKSETEDTRKGFILPDLNMEPDEGREL